eukprot:TRINITY_DN3666_c2_g1_i3.p1 TRINITY_DN3666_c2_g1~~TRINITY_DN3666_c2_g1_i3.p1  ORF type:complete len:2431 (-),score=776.48 TRINITY_DN3666_c2_g1_i3:1776-9068(-)
MNIEREIQRTQEIEAIWAQYRVLLSKQEKLQVLKDFLFKFLECFWQVDPKLLHYRFKHAADATRELQTLFISEIYVRIADSLRRKEDSQSSLQIYEYLCGISSQDEGTFLLLALEALTRSPSALIITGMTSTIVSVLTNLLSIPSHAVASTSQRSPSNFFSTFNFPPIYSYFSMPLCPPPMSSNMSGLNATATSSLTASTRIGKSASDIPMTSMMGGLCYHLLAILQNLFSSPKTIQELISSNQLKSLLEIFILSSQGSDELVVHKQLIRCLCSMMMCASRDMKAMVVLQQEVIPYLLNLMKKSSLATVIRLELCLFFIFAIKKSSSMTLVLFEEFQKNGGYAVLAENILFIGENGTKEERMQVIAATCHLLFIGGSEKFLTNDHHLAPPTSTKAVTVKNINVFKMLLTVFEMCNTQLKLKTELLSVILSIFSLDKSAEGLFYLEQLEPFKILFSQFDKLNLSNQKSILNLMDNILLWADVFLPEEYRYYCQLLQGKRPSTTILVMSHVMKLIENQKLNRPLLRKAGLITQLTEYAVHPNGLPFFAALRQDQDELKLSELLLKEAKCFPAELQDQLENQVERVIWGISRLALDLTRVALTNSTENQIQFKDSNGMKKIYGLLADEIQRKLALHVISFVAIGDTSLESKVVPDLISELQSSGGTGSLNLTMLRKRQDILSSLCYVFRNNEVAKTVFRMGGGFIWTVSVLDGIGQVMEKRKKVLSEDSQPAEEFPEITVETDLEIFGFLKTLLHTLSVVLTNDASNQTYFREHIHFSTLSQTLQACHLIEGTRAVELCDSLLNIAVKGTWPPSCPKHAPPIQLPPPWESGNPSDELISTDSTSLSQSRACTSTCSQCREALFIENPEIFKLIIQILSAALRKKDSHQHLSYYVYILQVLSYLTDVMQFNQQKLSDIDLAGDIITCFKDALLVSSELQANLLALIHKVASFNVTLEGLMKYLSLMREPNFPLEILENFVELAKRENIPVHYADFTKNALGYVHVPTLSDRMWPPNKGYSLAFWIHIAALPTKELGNIMVCCFETPSRQKLEVSITPDGIFDLTAPSSKDSVKFPDFIFQVGKWYHVVMSHGGKGIGNKGSAVLYINGLFTSQTKVPTGKGALSKVAIRFGSTVAPTSIVSPSWQLGNVFFFEDILTPKEAFLMFILGPNYVGGLEADLTDYRVYDFITAKNLIAQPELEGLLVDPSTESQLMHNLQEKLAFAFSIRNMVMAQSVKIPFFPTSSTNSPTVTRTLAPSYARIFTTHRSNSAPSLSTSPPPSPTIGQHTPTPSSHVSHVNQPHVHSTSTATFVATGTNVCSPPSNVCTRMSVKEMIGNVGGISSIIYLIITLKGPGYQRAGIQLLQALLSYNARNVAAINSICGYELLGRLLRREHWHLDEVLLAIIFEQVGLTRSQRNPSFSNGVITNLPAFKYLILDWVIWKRATASVQKLLFKSLADLVDSTHELSTFNIRRFREAKVMEIFFRMFQEFEIPGFLRSDLTIILKSIMSDPPSTSDLQMILNYLVATHENHPTVINYSSPTKLMETPRTIRRAVSFQKEKFSGQISGFSTRTFILKVLLELLVSGGETVMDRFSQLCSLDVLFGLIRTDSLVNRIYIIKILDLVLQDPKIYESFEMMKGFHLLGNFMAPYSLSEELFGTLFCMLLGKPAHKYTDATHLRPFLVNCTSPGISISKPSAIYPILVLVGAEQATPMLQHTVIKSLHDLYLQNDQVKQNFMVNDVIRLLCDLFSTELDRKEMTVRENMGRKILFSSPGNLGRRTSDSPVARRPSTDVHRTSLQDEVQLEKGKDFDEFFSDEEKKPEEKKGGKIQVGEIEISEEDIPEDDPENIPQISPREGDDQWIVEEDIIAFLKAVTLHGCMTNNDISLVDDTLITLSLLTDLPTGYVQALQRKILFDVLSFFHESSWSRFPNLVETFKSLCLLACNFLCHDPVPSADPKSKETLVTRWEDLPGIPSELKFIKLLFDVLFSTKSNLSADASQNFWNSFGYHVNIHNQYGRLIIDLLHSKKFVPYIDWTIEQLAKKPSIVSEVYEDLVFRLLFYTQPFLSDENRAATTWAIWQEILSKKRSHLKNAFVGNFPTNIEDAKKAMFQSAIMLEVKKGEENAASSLLQWQSGRSNAALAKIPPAKEKVLRNSSLLTNSFIELQQNQTKDTLSYTQKNMEIDKELRRQWKILLKKVTHERGVWPYQGRIYWKLDPTEGTHRTRVRLKKETILPPFLVPYSAQNTAPSDSPQTAEMISKRFMEWAVSPADAELSHPNFSRPDERISSPVPCSRINPFNKRDGELLIGENFIYFIDDGKAPEKQRFYVAPPRNVAWSCEDIVQVHKRRYLLKSNALEIFLANGKTYLLAFDQQTDRDTVYEQIKSLNTPNRIDYESEVTGFQLENFNFFFNLKNRRHVEDVNYEKVEKRINFEF